MDSQNSRPQSPWQATAATDSIQPPMKRQKLSPVPPSSHSPVGTASQNSFSGASQTQSPYANTPTFQQFSLPNAFTSNRIPSLDGTMNGRSSMGPPQRPSDKAHPDTKQEPEDRRLDINDLQDLVTSSGIDLRKEEEFITQSFSRQQSGQQSYQPPQRNNFDLLNQNNFSLIGNRGTLNQQHPKHSAEEDAELQHKRAARNLAQTQQHHLDDSFLLGNAMRIRIERAANTHGAKVPMDGLFDAIGANKSAVKPELNTTTRTGADGSSISVVKAPSILNRGSPLDSIMSLLSLACNERLRGLLEDAYRLSRGRRAHSHGIVPPDWSDLAVGVQPDAAPVATEVRESASISGTSWDKTASQRDGATEATTKGKRTISFPPGTNPLIPALNEQIKRERKAEEARIKRRKEREARKANPTATDDAAAPETDAVSTQPLEEKAPEVKMTKKEREKMAKQGASEEVQTRAANAAASLALGGNKYSWMTGGGGAKKPTFGTPKSSSIANAAGAATGAGQAAATSAEQRAGKDGSLAASNERKFGTWREDAVGGKGVQLRDWTAALESDGRDRKTLAFALARMNDTGSNNSSNSTSNANSTSNSNNKA